jgi:predicted ATP-binding protein involved in virulence
MDILRTNLQRNRRRSNLTSTVLNFESDRTIQNVQPFAFSWDLPDPLTEEMGWEFSLVGWKNRWQDTIHSLFRLIEHQKQGIASRAVELRRQGKTEMKLSFSDPMDSFKNVFSQLLAPKELVDPSARQQTLQYRLGDQEFDISTLSSGEREVVNIAFDFLLRRPQHCVVFFDEPELHLHPELSYRLIQVLQTIGVQNQFILSTHSPDIITASLDRSVIFLSPPREQADGTPARLSPVPLKLKWRPSA